MLPTNPKDSFSLDLQATLWKAAAASIPNSSQRLGQTGVIRSPNGEGHIIAVVPPLAQDCGTLTIEKEKMTACYQNIFNAVQKEAQNNPQECIVSLPTFNIGAGSLDIKIAAVSAMEESIHFLTTNPTMQVEVVTQDEASLAEYENLQNFLPEGIKERLTIIKGDISQKLGQAHHFVIFPTRENLHRSSQKKSGPIAQALAKKYTQLFDEVKTKESNKLEKSRAKAFQAQIEADAASNNKTLEEVEEIFTSLDEIITQFDKTIYFIGENINDEQKFPQLQEKISIVKSLNDSLNNKIDTIKTKLDSLQNHPERTQLIFKLNSRLDQRASNTTIISSIERNLHIKITLRELSKVLDEKLPPKATFSNIRQLAILQGKITQTFKEVWEDRRFDDNLIYNFSSYEKDIEIRDNEIKKHIENADLPLSEKLREVLLASGLDDLDIAYLTKDTTNLTTQEKQDLLQGIQKAHTKWETWEEATMSYFFSSVSLADKILIDSIEQRAELLRLYEESKASANEPLDGEL